MMIKKPDIPAAADSRRSLVTEYPLSEKDEQARCMERMRKLQSDALKLWRALKLKKKRK